MTKPVLQPRKYLYFTRYHQYDSIHPNIIIVAKPWWSPAWSWWKRYRQSAVQSTVYYEKGIGSLQYKAFFHHYQGSIDFNTVNVHRTVGMYFLVSTGNRADIEWHDLQRSYLSNTFPAPGSVRINAVPRDSISPYTPYGEYQEHILARKTWTMFQQWCR